MTVIWRCGVIGNTKDFDSFIVGSNPAGAAKNVEDIRTSSARTVPARTQANPCSSKGDRAQCK